MKRAAPARADGDPQDTTKLGGSWRSDTSNSEAKQDVRAAAPRVVSAPLDEHFRVALKGAAYFAETASIDLEDGDRENLRSRMESLRQIVIQALKAYNELPPQTWPNAETREAFGRDAVEWRKDRNRADPVRVGPDGERRAKRTAEETA